MTLPPKRAKKQRKKSAPLPAFSLPVASDQGKALRNTTGEIAAVNRLRNTRLKTSGGYG